MACYKSIWVNESLHIDDYESLANNILELWPNKNIQTSNRLFNVDWMESKFERNLQNFTSNLANRLCFQMVEIFMSKPFPVESEPNESHMVSGAYRKSVADNDIAGFDTDTKLSGVYSLTHSKLVSLRNAILLGEPIKHVESRINQLRDNCDDGDNLWVNHTLYTLLSSAIACAAGITPDHGDHPASFAWKFVSDKKFGVVESWARNASTGKPSKNIQAALRYIIKVYGQSIIEIEDINGFSSKVLSTVDSSTIHKLGFNEEDLQKAIKMWVDISMHRDNLAILLVKNIEDIPIRFARLMFESKLRSYPHWLKSATLSVEKKKNIVLFGNLRDVVYEYKGKLNQSVNYASLIGYEQAADWLLKLKKEKGKPKANTLKSMLLCPFTVDLGDGRIVSGFFRFMNRLHTPSGKPVLYQYEQERVNAFSWSPCDKEMVLGLALQDAMSEILPRHLATETNHDYSLENATSSNNSNSYKPNKAHNKQVDKLLGDSKKTSILKDKILRMSNSVVTEPIILLGEEGVGKTYIAEIFHKCSALNIHSFVHSPVSKHNDGPAGPGMGALFGYKKGAFTGADEDRPGILEKIGKGTLFLDEIGDSEEHLQSALLTLVENRTFSRIGETDVKHRVFGGRFIFATNKNLRSLVSEGKFRSDLISRLAFKIIIPPLRERVEDIGVLSNHFLSAFADKKNIPSPKLSDDAIQYLEGQRWEDNIRGVRNVMLKLVTDYEETVLEKAHVEAAYNEYIDERNW